MSASQLNQQHGSSTIQKKSLHQRTGSANQGSTILAGSSVSQTPQRSVETLNSKIKKKVRISKNNYFQQKSLFSDYLPFSIAILKFTEAHCRKYQQFLATNEQFEQSRQFARFEQPVQLLEAKLAIVASAQRPRQPRPQEKLQSLVKYCQKVNQQRGKS